MNQRRNIPSVKPAPYLLAQATAVFSHDNVSKLLKLSKETSWLQTSLIRVSMNDTIFQFQGVQSLISSMDNHWPAGCCQSLMKKHFRGPCWFCWERFRLARTATGRFRGSSSHDAAWPGTSHLHLLHTWGITKDARRRNVPVWKRAKEILQLKIRPRVWVRVAVVKYKHPIVKGNTWSIYLPYWHVCTSVKKK